MSIPGKGRQPAEIETTVTFLEMRERPTNPSPPVPVGKIAILRADPPTVPYYRFLYNTVGKRWLWWERRVMGDEALGEIIGDPAVEIFTLLVSGVPAGFCELDGRTKGEVEVAYFGLMDEFLGKGLGRYFLHWTVDQAWQREPERVWVHTCTLDHPAALSTYQKAGFEVYRRETEIIRNPGLVAVVNDD